MKRNILLLSFLLLFIGVSDSNAQSVTGSYFLAWDQNASSMAEAQGYTYKYYPDGSTSGITLSNIVCGNGASATSFQCTAPFPAFTPGKHTLTISATNVAGESTKSSPFDFSFVVVPAAPANLRALPTR